MLVDQENRSPRKLYRSRRQRVLAGVCGGLAEYLNVDVVIVRLVWVLLAVMGPGIVGYPVAWLVVPLAPEGEATG